MRVSILGCKTALAVALVLAVLALPLAFRGPHETRHHAPGALATLVRIERPREAPAMLSKEAAVAEGLRWLAAHQCRDGGWNFDHGRDNGHVGPVRNAGRGKSRTHATAVCLVGFLSKGQTHHEGTYRDAVLRGLKFLEAQTVRFEGVEGDLRGEEGSVAAQAWATLALCELYAQTQDKVVKPSAQRAVQVLELMRDPAGGGWAKEPRKPGDTLTTARAILALKCAHSAYLDVSPAAVNGAVAFLNSVQSAEGAHYGLTKAGDGQPATHVAGILCRGHLSWWRNHEAAVDRNLQEACERGPLPKDLDFNDFASQALELKGADAGHEFRQRLRLKLIDTQVATGEAARERGSWASEGHPYAESGGRLYETATHLILLSRQRQTRPLIIDDDEF